MALKSNHNIRILKDAAELNAAMAGEIARLSKDAIAQRGICTLVLSGGSTPKSLYALMATPAWQGKFDWTNTVLFWGDERCVPPDHADSNYAMVKRELLSKVRIPGKNIHRMITESGTPEEVAAAYEETVRRETTSADENKAKGTPRFDIVLLGLGTNGHTASLFPHTIVLHETARLVAACYVEEVSSHRITVTAPLLNNAKNIFFLVSGAEKAEVLNSVLNGPSQTEKLPAQLIKPSNGSLIWMIDKPAARLLPGNS